MSNDIESEMKKIELRYVPPRLTKREHAAIACLQGLLAWDGDLSYESAEVQAIGHADFLLAELEKQP